MTPTAPSTPGVLTADRPNNGQIPATGQFVPEPIARQRAGVAATCPRQVRHDPAACADHPQGVMAAHGITDLLDRGRRLAGPHLAVADAGWKDINLESLPEVDSVDVSPRSPS